MNRVDDVELLVRARRGDERAFGQQFARYQPVVKAPLHSIPAEFCASLQNSAVSRCIPPICVVHRSNTAGIFPLLALLSGRIANLGATRGSTTGCYQRAVPRYAVYMCGPEHRENALRTRRIAA